MQSFRGLSLVAVLFLASCAGPQAPEKSSPVAVETPAPAATRPVGKRPLFKDPAQTKLATAQIGVYSQLLTEMSYKRKIVSPDDSFIIKEQSIGSGDVTRLASDPLLEQETLDAFVAANSQAENWRHQFDVYVDYKVVPAAGIPPVGSKEFKKKFPKARCVLGLSKVGLDKEWTRALTMTEIECEGAEKRTIYWLLYADEDGLTSVKELATR